MTLQDLINLTEGRELSKCYPKADGLYIWDYKVVGEASLELIPSNTGKLGFQDKVSIQELLDYIQTEYNGSPVSLEKVNVTGVELVTLAKA